MDSNESLYVIKSWEDNNAINMSEYIIPDNGFQSFNQFFYRQIKPECRPICESSNPSVIVSPVDGTYIQTHTNLTMHQTYPVILPFIISFLLFFFKTAAEFFECFYPKNR